MGKESFDSDTAASDFTARVERLCPVQSTARTSLGALWNTLQPPLGSSVVVTSLPPSTTSLSPKCIGLLDEAEFYEWDPCRRSSG
jgi:hypothetical protein